MGTTAQKLQRVLDTKEGLKDTINTYLGQDITSAIPFKDYETYIKNFYNSLPKTSYSEGSNITLSNTLKGKLDFEEDEDGKKKIGYGQTEQKSYTGKNLFPPIPSFNRTINGVTVTSNNGKLTLKGTATASINEAIWGAWGSSTALFTIPTRGNYYASGIGVLNASPRLNLVANGTTTVYGGSSLHTFTSNTNITGVFLFIENGTTVDITFEYQIESGISATSYEPYVGGQASPNPSYPQDIEVVRGKNEANPNNLYLGQTLNTNGTLTPLDNRTTLFENPIKPNTQYTLSINNNYQIGNLFYYNKDKTFLSPVGSEWGNSKTAITPANAYYISFATKKTDNTTMTESDIENLQIQIEKGSQATSYLPYNTIEVKTSNGNLFYSSEADYNSSGLNVKFKDNHIILNGTTTALLDIRVLASSPYSQNTFSLEILDKINSKNGSYVISNNSGLVCYFVTTNTSYKANTMNVTDNEKVSQIFIRVPNGSTFDNKDIEFQIENGSVATSYQVHEETTQQLSLGDKELYTDSEIVRVGKNNFKFVDKWKKIFIDSNDIASVSKGCGIFHNKYFIDVADVDINSYNTIPPILSNIDKSEKWNYINDNDDLGGKMFLLKLAESQNQFRLYLNATTVQEAKTNLDNSNAYFIYKAITPIETPITDTTLINQLENFYNSHSFTGTTIIEIDGQLPMIIKVRALKGE